MSKFIPNSFQVPNAYIDELWHLLTAEEVRVLMYMCRRIFGFNRESNNVSITQITTGTVSKKTGLHLDRGCRISRAYAMKVVESLKIARIIIEVSPNDPVTRQGAVYKLQLDSSNVNLQWLEDRKLERESTDRQRTESARAVSGTDRTILKSAVSGTDRSAVSGTDRSAVSGTDRTLLYRNTEEKQKETQKKKNGVFEPIKGTIESNHHWVWLKGLCGYGIIVPAAALAGMHEAVIFLDGIAATDEQKKKFMDNWQHFWKAKPPRGRKRPYPRDVPVDWENVLNSEPQEEHRNGYVSVGEANAIANQKIREEKLAKLAAGNNS